VVVVARPGTKPEATAHFVGYTNSPSGRQAMFTISNAGPAGIRVVGLHVAKSSATVDGTPWFYPVILPGSVVVDAGASQIITFAAPTNMGAWRIMATCVVNRGYLPRLFESLKIQFFGGKPQQPFDIESGLQE
jgi:hypothetical protein